jgi:hypothetical protein
LLSQAQNKKEIQYLVGSINFPEYKPVTKIVDVSSYTFTSSNVTAPILHYYVHEKKKFIGGTLFDEKGNSTLILNVKLTEVNNVPKFEIVGKDFSRSFTTKTGIILKEEKAHMVFYTDGVGIWKVNKKTTKN